MSFNSNPFRRGTRNWTIAGYLLQGMRREDIYRTIYPEIIAEREPWIFSNNVNGRRIPKSVNDAIPLGFYSIGACRELLLSKNPDCKDSLVNESNSDSRNYGNKRWRIALFNEMRNASNNTPNAEPVNYAEPEFEAEIELEQEIEIIPVHSARNTIRGKLEYLFSRLNELRDFVESKRVGGREFDFISTRAFNEGRRAIIAGIDPDDFLVSIGISWDADTRRQAGIKDNVDFSRYAIEGTDLLVGYVVLLMTAGIPVYLCGPTGSGKSYLARQCAEYMQLNYSEIALSLGVSRTDLFGNWNAKGFVERPFTNCYANGGVFCFEELDAADANILLSVNNAIANDRLFNSSNGAEINRHENFIPIATANTWGNGATANYGAREGLDSSSLDRFKYGRIQVSYNPAIEYDIMFAGIDELELAENVDAVFAE